MDLLEALILGIVQGLTEFLPVSSSGHLEIGKAIFGIDAEASFSFSIAVHGATVLSTIVVFWQEIIGLLRGALKLKYNDETRYILKIFVSLVPVIIVGLFFKDDIESFFNGDIRFVGFMLLITSALLILSSIVKTRKRKINYFDAFIIGIAQAMAVLPGISRSGATISTGIVLGNSRDGLARFSFLMVLIPVIGANFVELLSGDFSSDNSVGFLVIITGFISAFVTGYIACKWMIGLVKKGKLYWFGIYCLLLGLLTLIIA